MAKAGLVASLPARTSLLAAANPAGGQYNRAKTLLQNLKMSAAMLSRFDIIFVLLDQPDQRRDERLSEHVMAMHSGNAYSVQTVWVALIAFGLGTPRRLYYSYPYYSLTIASYPYYSCYSGEQET